MTGMPPIERSWDEPKGTEPSPSPGPPEKPPKKARTWIILASMGGIVAALVIVAGLINRPADSSLPAAGTAAPTATTTEAPPSLPTESSSAASDKCTRYQDLVNQAVTDTEAKVTAENARFAGCEGIVVPGKPEGRPTNPAAASTSTGGYEYSRDGIDWAWVDNARCDYGSCVQIKVSAGSADCSNGFYIAVNVLNSSGTIVGYSNDALPSLRRGQSAIMTFQITEDDADKVEMSELTCY